MKHSATIVVDDYAHTRAMLSRQVTTDAVALEFPTYRPVRSAFAAMVNRRQFDFCEMALATYIQAVATGSPITLLPVTMLARFQHPNLLHDLRRPLRDPSDVAGRRVGLQSYAQTTGVWMRGILSRQYGVAAPDVQWVSLEAPHVEGFVAPPNVSQAPEGTTMAELLDSGAVDAAIVSRPLEGSPQTAPVITDIESATRDWYDRTGVLQVNHVMCVRTELVESDPDLVVAVLDLFRRSRLAAAVPRVGPAWAADLDPIPSRTAALAPVIDLARELAIEQELIGPELTLADLMHASMPELEGRSSRPL